jgi:hypothetical protein
MEIECRGVQWRIRRVDYETKAPPDTITVLTATTLGFSISGLLRNICREQIKHIDNGEIIFLPVLLNVSVLYLRDISRVSYIYILNNFCGGN